MRSAISRCLETNLQTILHQAEIMFVVEVIDIVPKRADDVVILPGNNTDGLRLSRKRTIYMLKMGAKVTNRSFGRKDANFRRFCQSADNQCFAKIKGLLAFFCILFCLL